MSLHRTADHASDIDTAQAFAHSWNHAGAGSVYSREQFLDWFAPLDPADFSNRTVIELGFGNGSLLYHMAAYAPAQLCGVELGDTLDQTYRNLEHARKGMIELHRGDLIEVDLGQFDLAYSIGVLHHLRDPEAGFLAVLRHTRPGGHFHCWVYAREGNGLIRALIDPIRRVACRLPWWFTKYALAISLVLPHYLYAKCIGYVTRQWPAMRELLHVLPLYQYSIWISERPFRFFHHVAFDQLVAPQTAYIRQSVIESWLKYPDVDPQSVYIVFRNGNSWKFGGRKRTSIGSGGCMPDGPSVEATVTREQSRKA